MPSKASYRILKIETLYTECVDERNIEDFSESELKSELYKRKIDKLIDAADRTQQIIDKINKEIKND